MPLAVGVQLCRPLLGYDVEKHGLYLKLTAELMDSGVLHHNMTRRYDFSLESVIKATEVLNFRFHPLELFCFAADHTLSCRKAALSLGSRQVRAWHTLLRADSTASNEMRVSFCRGCM